MFAQLSLTEMLAAFIGLYFLSAGTGLILSANAYLSMLQELLENRLLSYLSGIMVFLIGAVIVGIHDQWHDFLSVFVSFVGWAALVEGVLLLAVPQQFIGLFAKINVSEPVMCGIGTATAAAGLALLTAIFI